MTDSFPVILGTCLDAEAIWLGKAPENINRPALLSHGTYEINEGLPAMLDLYERQGIQTTFFVPGVTADRYPDAVREIARRGHELGSHGYNHLSPLLLDAVREREELVGGMDAIERACGHRPVTWRSPSWEFTTRTIDLLLATGVKNSTNLHDRSRPYRHQRAGQSLALVELPVEWHLADAPYFMHAGLPGRVIFPPAIVEELWREEFLGLMERPGSFLHLTLHPQLIGHPGRLRMLERFIVFMRQHARVRFMRCDELAATVA